MTRGGTPFPHIPLDEVGGAGLMSSPGMMTTVLANIFKHHLSTEVKVGMLYDGRPAFLQKCAQSFGHLGLSEKNYNALWTVLNEEIPQVHEALKRPS